MDDGLAALLLDLLAMPCGTGHEGPIADWLVDRYAGQPLTRVGNSVVVGVGDADDRPTVALVGHLDVVPPTDEDREPRVDGDRIVGRGASDMKAGLAVAMACFEDAALRTGPYRVLLVAYAGEEGAHAGNELGSVLAEVPELATADLAIVLEPTDLTVQLGCLGVVQAEMAFTGRGAHSARPWQGANALTAAGAFLGALDDPSPDDRHVDGLTYHEVLVPTVAWTGTRERPAQNARNVVPDRFTVNVSYRFAPDRSLDEAVAVLHDLAARYGAEATVTDRAPAAPPHRDAPLVGAFVAAADAPVQPKQAWTDVARLSDAGVPALNYGPGLTAQAHQAGEHVPATNLAVARGALARFLAG